MIIINKNANREQFSVVSNNIDPTGLYGSPPIHYWYRNVVEALRLIDDGYDKEEGIYRDSLENSLSDVYHDVRYR